MYSDDKDGADAGVLVGRDPVGVTASADVDRVLAIDADCVLCTPRLTDLDEVAILAGGKNVVTTAFLFHPDRLPAADRDRLLAAYHAGGVSVHGSGLNPGNLSGALPLAMAAMSRTIDKLTLQERADWSVYDSTAITLDNMRFGAPVDEVTASVEAVAAGHDHEIFDHVLRAGTTAGQRWNWGAARRCAIGEDRDAVDGRKRVPQTLAQPAARLDADHRRRPVDAHPLRHAGELHP